jgi:hypothetical protein
MRRIADQIPHRSETTLSAIRITFVRRPSNPAYREADVSAAARHASKVHQRILLATQVAGRRHFAIGKTIGGLIGNLPPRRAFRNRLDRLKASRTE